MRMPDGRGMTMQKEWMRWLDWNQLLVLVLILLNGFLVLPVHSATSWPNIPNSSTFNLTQPSPVVINSTGAPIISTNWTNLRWNVGGTSRLNCWEYLIYVSRKSPIDPATSKPSGEPAGVEVPFVGLQINSPTRADFWWDQTKEDRKQCFKISTADITNLPKTTMPSNFMRLHNLTEGTYYWTVHAVSYGTGWYFTDLPGDPYEPPWYGSALYNNWGTLSVPGSVYLGPNQAVNSNRAWYQKPYNNGCFIVDFKVDNVSTVYAGPIPYRNITEFSNKDTIYATWVPVSDAGSGISDYLYRIEDVTAGTWLVGNLADWSDAGLAINHRNKPTCSVRASGLSLVSGHDYRVHVKARDRGGHVSTNAAASPVMTYNPDAILGDTRRNVYDILVDMSGKNLNPIANDWYNKGDGIYYNNGYKMTWSAATLLTLPGAGSAPGGDSRTKDWAPYNLGPLNKTTKSETWQWSGGTAGLTSYPKWHVQYWGPVKMGIPLVKHGGDFTDPNYPGEPRAGTMNSYFTTKYSDDTVDDESEARQWEAYYDSQFPVGEYYWTGKHDPSNPSLGWLTSPSMEFFLANGSNGGVFPGEGVIDYFWLKQETWYCNNTAVNQFITVNFKVDNRCEIWLNSHRIAERYVTGTNYLDASMTMKPGWNHLVIFYQDNGGDDGLWLRNPTNPLLDPLPRANLAPFAPFDVVFEAFIQSYGNYAAKYVSAPIKLEAPIKLTALNWWETAPIINERMVDKDYVPNVNGHYGALITMPPGNPSPEDELVRNLTYNSVFPVTDSNGNTYSDASTIGQPDNIPTNFIVGKKYKIEFFIQNTGTMGWDITNGFMVQALWFDNNLSGDTPEVHMESGVSLTKRTGDWKSGDPPYDVSRLAYTQEGSTTVAQEVWVPEVLNVSGGQSGVQGGKVRFEIKPPADSGFYFLKLNMFNKNAGGPSGGGFGQPFGKFVQVLDQANDYITVSLEVADLATGPWVQTTSEAYVDTIMEDLWVFDWGGGKPEKDAVKYLRFQVNISPFSTYSADPSDYIGPTSATTASAAPAVLATPYFHAISISYQYDATPKVLNLIPSDTRWYAGYPYGITSDAYCVDGAAAMGTAELTLYEDEWGTKLVRVYTLFSQTIDPTGAIVDGDSSLRLLPARYYNNGQKRWLDNGTNRKYIFQLAPDFSCIAKYPKLWGRVRVYHHDDMSVFGEYPVAASKAVMLCNMFGDVHFRPFNPAGSNISEKGMFVRTVKNSLNQSHYVLPNITSPPSNVAYYYDQSDPNAVGDVEMNAIYFNGEIFFDSSQQTNLTFDDAYAWNTPGGLRQIWRTTVFTDYDDALRTTLFKDPAGKPTSEEEFNKITNYYNRAEKSAEITLSSWDYGTDNWSSLGNATRHVLNVDAQSNVYVKFETWFYETGDKRRFQWVTESCGQVWINGEQVAGQYRSGPYDVADTTYSLQEVTLKTLAGWNHLVVYVTDVAGQNDSCNGIAYLLDMPVGQIVAYPEDTSIVGTLTYDLITAHPKPQPNGHELMDFYQNNRGTVIEVLMEGVSTLTHQGKLAVEPTHAGIFWASPGDCFKIAAGKPGTGGDHHYAMQVKNVLTSMTSEILVKSDVEHGIKGRFLLHINHKPNIPVEALPIHLDEAVYVLKSPWSEIEVIQERDPILRIKDNVITDIDNPPQSGSFHHSRYVADYRPPVLAPYVERTDEIRYCYAIATAEATLPANNVPSFGEVTYYHPADWMDPAFDTFPRDTHQVNLVQANLQEAHYDNLGTLAPVYYYRGWAKDEHNELRFTPSAFKRFIIDNTPPVVYDIQVYHDKEVVRLDKDESPFYTSMATPGTNPVTLHGHVLTLWAACSDEICASPKKFKEGKFFIRKHIDPAQAEFLDTVNYPWTTIVATVEIDLKVIGNNQDFQFTRRPEVHPDGLVWYAYYTVPNDAELGLYDVDFQVTDAVGNTSVPLFQRTSEVQFRDLVLNQFEVRTYMLETFSTKPETRIKSVLAEWSTVKDHRSNNSQDHYILSVGDISPQPYNTNNWVAGDLIRITKEVTVEGLNPVFFSPVEQVDRLGFTNEFRDFIFTFENVNSTTNRIDGWREDVSSGQLKVGDLDGVIRVDGAFSWKSFAKGVTPDYTLYKEFDIGHNKRVAFGGWLRLKDEMQVAIFKVICYDTAGLVTGTFQTQAGTLGTKETAWVEYFVRDSAGNPYFYTPLGTVKIRLVVQMNNGDSSWVDNLALASYSEVFVDLTPPATPEPVFTIKDNHMNTGDQALAWSVWEGVPDVRGSAWIDESGNFPTLVATNIHGVKWTNKNARFGESTLIIEPDPASEFGGMYFGSSEIRLYPKAGEVFSMMTRLNFTSGDSDEVLAKKCKGLGVLLNDGVDWNAGFYWSDTTEITAPAKLKTHFAAMVDAAPNPDVFVDLGALPKNNLWRFLEVPFDDIGLSGHEVAGFAVVAWFEEPPGYLDNDSCSVQIDYVGIAAGSGVDFYYPQLKMEDVNQSARYKDLAQFKETDYLGRSVSYSGWMTEDQIFFDDEQFGTDSQATSAIQFTGEKSLIVSSDGPGSRVYDGTRLYGQANLRVSKMIEFSPTGVRFAHYPSMNQVGGAIVLFARPVNVDTNTDSLSELNIGIKWRVLGATGAKESQIPIAKFRAAQLRPRSLLPPKFDQLYPIGVSTVDIPLARLTRDAIDAGSSLMQCSDPLQVGLQNLIMIPPASSFFDAGVMSRNLTGARWEPYLIPISRLVPADRECTVEIQTIYIETTNATVAIDAMGVVKAFENNPDWIGDMDTTNIFENNEKPETSFHYYGMSGEVVLGMDGSTSIQLSIPGTAGTFTQSIRVRDSIVDRDNFLMQVPGNGGLIVLYFMLLDEKDSWPEELMLEFHTTSDGPGFYPHRAYWGLDQIAKGDVERPDAPDHYYMGPIPFEEAKNNWRALMVPTGLLDLNGKKIDEIVINVWNQDTGDVDISFDRIGLAGLVQDIGTYRKHFTFTWNAPDYTFYMYRTRAWDKIQNASEWGYSALTMSQDRTPPTMVHNMTSMINYQESGITQPLGGLFRDDPSVVGDTASIVFNYDSSEVVTDLSDITKYPPLDISITTDMSLDFRVVPYFGPAEDRFFLVHNEGAPRPQFGESLQQVYGQFVSAYDPSPSVGYVVGEWQIDRVSGASGEVVLSSASPRLEGSCSVILVDADTLEFEMIWPAATSLTNYQINTGDFVQFQINGLWERVKDYHMITSLIDNAGVYNKLQAKIGGITVAGAYPFRIYKAASNNSADNLWMVDPQKRFTEAHYFFQNGENYVASYFLYDSDRNFVGPYNVYVDVTPGKIASFRFYNPSPAVSKVTLRSDSARFDVRDTVSARLVGKDTCFWVGARAYDAVGNIVMKNQEVLWTWNGTYMDADNRVHNYIDDFALDFAAESPRHANLPWSTVDASLKGKAYPLDVLVRMTANIQSVRNANYYNIGGFIRHGDPVLPTQVIELWDLSAPVTGEVMFGPDRTVYRRPMRPFFEIGYHSNNPKLAEELLSDLQYQNTTSLKYSTQEVWISSLTGYNADGQPWLINPPTTEDQARRKDGSDELTSGDSEAYFIPSVRAGETFFVNISIPDGSVYAQSPLITIVPGDVSSFDIYSSFDQDKWEKLDKIELVASEGFVYLKTIAYDYAMKLIPDRFVYFQDGTTSVYFKSYQEGTKLFTFEDRGTNEIIIKPLWFTSHQEGVYAGMSGTVENDVIAGTLPWDQRYKFDNKSSAGVFLFETFTSLNQYTAGRQLSRLTDDWKIFAVATTEAAFEDNWKDMGGFYATESVDLPTPFQAELDSPLNEYTGVKDNLHSVFNYPFITNSPQLKSYIDHQWKVMFGGTIENILEMGVAVPSNGNSVEVMVYNSVDLKILPPTKGFLGFREPNAVDGTPGEQRTRFNCTSFVGGDNSKIDGSDYRQIFIQIYDPFQQFMDYENTTEVSVLMETEDKAARIIPLCLITFDPTDPELKQRVELQESDFTDNVFNEKYLRRSVMSTAEMAFYGTQDVRLLVKYSASLGRTVEVGIIRSQPEDDNLIVSFSTYLGNGSVPVLIAGIDKRKPITLRLFDLKRIDVTDLKKQMKMGINRGTLEVEYSEAKILRMLDEGYDSGSLEVHYINYEDASDLNPNSTATITTWPNRHDDVHFEPPIHIANPVVKLVEGRKVTIKASAYDKNANMLDNLQYFSPGWSVDMGAIQVMDDKGNHPVHYQNDITPLPFLFSHYDSAGVDPAGGTITVRLWGEYDFVHFGKFGQDATVQVQIIEEGWLDVVTLGLFNFPCAYQELDLDKLDRDGVYKLSFWVKGYKVSDHANDDSAQIRAGLAFLPDGDAPQIADADLFDLFRGSIAGYKNGKRFETRDDWVKLETTFTLDGRGKSLNGNDGINVFDGVETLLLYVGTPGTAGAGAPPNYVLFDYVSIERVR